MDIHPVDIVIHIVNIVVLFVVLRILLYKPVKKFMQAREDRLKAEKQEVIDSRAETEELKKQYEEKLADAQNEAKNFPDIGEMIVSIECNPFVPQVRYVDEKNNIVCYFITVRLRYVNRTPRKTVEYEFTD